METHAHELHKAPGHGWKHYVFEFFMLFLAVFCGFLAENTRENIVNHEKEKHYIENIITDLKKDTENVSLSCHYQSWLVKKMERVLQLPIEKLNQVAVQDSLYQNLVPFYAGAWIFVPTNNTVIQLKNAGGFSAFSNQNVVDSISDLYYYYDSWVKINSDIYMRSYEKTADLATQLVRLPESNQDFNNDTLQLSVPDHGKVLIQNNNILFEQLYSNIRFQKGMVITCMEVEKEYARKAGQLLKLLQKDYGLK